MVVVGRSGQSNWWPSDMYILIEEDVTGFSTTGVAAIGSNDSGIQIGSV